MMSNIHVICHVNNLVTCEISKCNHYLLINFVKVMSCIYKSNGMTICEGKHLIDKKERNLLFTVNVQPCIHFK